MKQVHKIISVFLAIQFLLSSLGFSLNKMSCVKSGKAKLSFVVIEDCCTQKENTIAEDCCDDSDEINTITENNVYFSKTDCCNITNSSLDLSDFQIGKKNNIPVAESTALFLADDYLTGLYNTKLPETKNNYSLYHPLLHGRNLLAHISVLLI